MRATPVAWTAALRLSSDVMTEGLVFALTRPGHRAALSEVSVIAVTLIMFRRRAPDQLQCRPASSRRALQVCFSTFRQHILQLSGWAAPAGPEAEPSAWFHIKPCAPAQNSQAWEVQVASGTFVPGPGQPGWLPCPWPRTKISSLVEPLPLALR